MRIILLTVALLGLAGCVFTDGRVKGNGDSRTEIRNPGSFTGVDLRTSFDVELRKGTTHGVEVRADRNLLEYIETRVEDNKLIIDSKKRRWSSSRNRVRIVVTAPNIDMLDVSGSGDVSGNLTLRSSDRVIVEVSGSGTVSATVDAPLTQISLSGSGDVELRGQTREVKADLSGSGDVNCFSLMSEAATVDLSGSGDAEIYASKQLDVSLSGSGDVQYKGKPAVTKNKSGSGSIAQAN